MFDCRGPLLSEGNFAIIVIVLHQIAIGGIGDTFRYSDSAVPVRFLVSRIFLLLLYSTLTSLLSGENQSISGNLTVTTQAARLECVIVV